MKSRLKTALAVLVPPFVGSAAYFGPSSSGVSDLAGNYLILASVSLLWWPFARFLRRKTFFGGIIGVHLAMAAFLTNATFGHLDDLGWLFYFPATAIGLVIGVVASRWSKPSRRGHALPFTLTAGGGRAD